jgi:hypothetical protein
MPTQIQLRRGNTAQTSSFTGAFSEITVDTDKNTIVVHDGITSGGTPLAKESILASSFVQANAAFDKANNEAGVNDTQNTNITTATTIATGAFVQSNSGFDKANSANVLAQQAFDAANNAFVQGGQIAFAQANAAFDKANNEAGVNETQNTNITTATNIASGAFIQANAAFDKANNALPNTGGSITGDLLITGNLVIIGSEIFANTETLLIKDNIITLNAAIDSSSTPSSNAGLEIARGSSSNVYLLWNEDIDVWQFSNDGTTFNTIADTSTVFSSFDKANSANVLAQQAFDKANNEGLVNNTQNTNITTATTIATGAFVQANAAFDKANNEAGVNGTQNTNITTATTIATGAFVQANSSFNAANNEAGVNATQNTNITTATNIATGAFVQANAAFAAANNEAGVNATQNTNITNATNIATGAFNKANAAVQQAFVTVAANGTNLVADSNTDTLTITAAVANGISVIGNATTDTLDIGLRPSGVITGTYGGAANNVLMTVDQFGRVVSVEDIPSGGGGTDFAYYMASSVLSGI